MPRRVMHQIEDATQRGRLPCVLPVAGGRRPPRHDAAVARRVLYRATLDAAAGSMPHAMFSVVLQRRLGAKAPVHHLPIFRHRVLTHSGRADEHAEHNIPLPFDLVPAALGPLMAAPIGAPFAVAPRFKRRDASQQRCQSVGGCALRCRCANERAPRLNSKRGFLRPKPLNFVFEVCKFLRASLAHDVAHLALVAGHALLLTEVAHLRVHEALVGRAVRYQHAESDCLSQEGNKQIRETNN